MQAPSQTHFSGTQTSGGASSSQLFFLINGPVVDTGLDRVTEYTNGCNGPSLFLQPYLSTFIFNQDF